MNVFKGILDNPLFYSILITTAVLQVIIVQFGSYAFHVYEDGLSGKFWGLSMALGFGSLPVQQVINVVYRIGQHYKGRRRNKKRLAKASHFVSQRTNGQLVHHT